MKTVGLQDYLCNHHPEFFTATKFILTRKYNEIDPIILTDTCVHIARTKKNCKKIALLFESPVGFKGKNYDYVYKNTNDFDLVLTFSKKLLDLKKPHIHLNLLGGSWLNKAYHKIYKKTKICSLIASNKNFLVGHKLRHSIIQYNNKIYKKNINNNILDCYGSDRWGKGPLYWDRTKSHLPTHISNKLILGFKDYMFCVVIENCKVDYFFTEKLIDCFLTGTIPIYWGCPSIGKFFNINGIITFDTKEECFDIIDTLSEEKYLNMLSHVKENFEEAKKYLKFKFNEKAILECIS